MQLVSREGKVHQQSERLHDLEIYLCYTLEKVLPCSWYLRRG